MLGKKALKGTKVCWNLSIRLMESGREKKGKINLDAGNPLKLDGNSEKWSARKK